MSRLNRLTQTAQNGFSSGKLGSLSIFFWLFTFVLAAVSYLTTEYLIKHERQKVEVAATISAKGLANILHERIEQHRLIIQTIALHHRDRIFSLSKGAGYPFDLSGVSVEINHLLPDVLRFAITDANGKVVVGSSELDLGKACQGAIIDALKQHNLTNSIVELHSHSTGQKHYDLVQKLQRGEELAGLIVSFRLNLFAELLAGFNTSNIEFVVVDSRSRLEVFASSQAIGDHFYGKEINSGVIDSGLASVPILGTRWTLVGLEKPHQAKHQAHQIRLIGFILFLLVFGIVLSLSMYLRNAELARKQLEEDSVQDALFNAGPTVLFQKQATERMMIQYVSPNILALLGCTQREALHKDYNQLILVKDRAKVRACLQEAFEQHASEVNLEYRLDLPGTKGYCWVNDVTHILYNDKGLCIALQSYVTSVHAQKMGEQYVSSLIEGAADAIAVTDEMGRVVRINQAFERMFEYDREEMVGRSIEICIDENSQEIFEEFQQAFIANNTSYSTTLGVNKPLFGMKRSSEELSIEVSLSSINSINGLQIVHIIRDVSVQIEAQRQMEIAKENAEALARARSRFVATMSHEIRTPLNGVLGMSNLLSSTGLSSKQHGYLMAIEYSGQSLLKIVSSILDFAKLDEGAVRLELTSFNLNKLVQDSLKIVQTIADETSVRLNIKSNLQGVDAFIGDVGRIQQILLNLIGNAIKFSPEGEVDIILTWEQQVPDELNQAHVRIEVNDNGIGIAEESLNQLFDCFTQADETTTRKYGGTGLGLAITKQLVEIMGGEIGVISTLHRGSQFWVKLPLTVDNNSPALGSQIALQKTVHEDESALTDLSVITNGSKDTMLAGKSILLIEDDPINQQVVSEFILRLGGRIDIAVNGLEGLSFWRTHSHRYAMVLMDCQMPMMDGYQVSALIRKEEAVSGLKPIPIVALTANAMAEDRERCFSVGMNDFIPKPIDVAVFNQVLIKWSSGGSTD